jgi:hypothetical protein
MSDETKQSGGKRAGHYGRVKAWYPLSGHRLSGKTLVAVLDCGHAVIRSSRGDETKTLRAWCAICTRAMPKETTPAKAVSLDAKRIAALVEAEVEKRLNARLEALTRPESQTLAAVKSNGES